MASQFVESICSRWIWRLRAGEGRIALTFDDSPDKHTTPELLAALNTLDIRATFFLNGENLEGNGQLLRDALTSGFF